ncbi:hypothetical protein P67b_00079 [Ruegeria phage Tedan]|nr:hypothetical protein P67b_00079 [Ruegeria phage Tedan]
MSLTTIVINGQNYIAYASVAEADARLAVDPVRGAAWALLTDDQKGINLVAATNRLDLENWSGEKQDPAQLNEWPRTNVFCDGEAVADGIIPPELENGTILLAGSIAINATASSAGTGPSNISRVGAGSARVDFFRPQTSTNFALSQQNPDVFALVRCLFDGAAGAAVGLGGSVAFGAGTPNEFDDEDRFGLREGWP